jgi:hypothetical protein
MFLVYCIIVWMRYMGDMNYPNRLFKFQKKFRSYYSPMNDLKRLSSYLTLNISNVALLRKFLLSMSLFLILDTKLVPLQSSIIICIYLFETVFHIGIFLQ